MKRITKLLMVAAVGLSLTIGGIVVAHGGPDGPGRGSQGSWQGRGMGYGYAQNHRGMMGYGYAEKDRGMGYGNAQYHRGMGYGYGYHRGMGPNNSEFKYGAGPGALLRDEMSAARVSVLAELSGKAVKDIEEQVKTKPFRTLLDEYQVNPEEFQAKMHAKVVLLVDEAAKAGKITEEQAKAMYERMNWMAENSYARGPHWGYGPRK